MKNKIIFLSLIFVTLTSAVFSGSKFLYFLFILVSCLFFQSYISIRNAEKKMHDYFRINIQTATVGDILKLRYKVLYKGVSPIPYSEINCKISKKLGNMTVPTEIVFISSFSTIFINKEFECKHRGYYKMGEVNLLITDMFNMFRKEIKFNKKIDLVVYPRFFHINNMKLPSKEFFGKYTVKNSLYEDYTSIAYIRDYRVGDNVKMIDWKSSAKHDDIKIKKNELSANTKVYILLDGYVGNFEDDINGACEELMIEATASIINYCLRKKIDTTILTNTEKKEQISGRELDRFNIFLKELTRFNVNGKIKYDEFLQIECRKITFSSTLILITTCIDDGLFSKTVRLKNNKFYPILVLIKNKDIDLTKLEEEKINHLINNGIDVYIIYSSKDIVSVLGGGE